MHIKHQKDATNATPLDIPLPSNEGYGVAGRLAVTTRVRGVVPLKKANELRYSGSVGRPTGPCGFFSLQDLGLPSEWVYFCCEP